MRVAVDARMINMSGIGTYIQNLMENDCYNIALGNKEEINNKHHFSDENLIEFDASIYGLKEQLKFPYKELKKLKPDVLHIPHYNVPLFYSGKMVVTIHDLTHLVYPEYLPNKLAYFYANFMMKRAIKKSSYVFTVSENSKKDILEHFKVNEDKVIVTYNGVNDKFCKKSKESIDYLYDKFKIDRTKKILMYVGNLKPHKNLERLLEAFSKASNNDRIQLLLVGKAFEKYSVLEQKEKDLGIDNKVIHTGIVTNDELVDLYNLSDLFVFPSLYEGFGLPVLEALRCGTPVICSNTSSMPEVGGDKVSYFNPLDVNEIKSKIEELIESKKDFNYDEAKKWCDRFSWKNTSEITKEYIEKA